MKNISTRIYAADVTVLNNEEWYRAAYRKVTNERRKKTDSYHFHKDRELSLGAELLLMLGLERLGMNPKEMRYHYGENGKPYLWGSQNVYFNLSHSEQIAICAISSQEIGCDVEKISYVNLELAKRFFFTTEYERIAAEKTVESRRDMFFRLWTLKESYIKMTGLGMSLPMNSFGIHFSAEGISVKQERNHKMCYFQEFNLRQNYKCSVCGLDSEIGTKNGVSFEMLNLSDILTMDCEKQSGICT